MVFKGLFDIADGGLGSRYPEILGMYSSLPSNAKWVREIDAIWRQPVAFDIPNQRM